MGKERPFGVTIISLVCLILFLLLVTNSVIYFLNMQGIDTPELFGISLALIIIVGALFFIPGLLIMDFVTALGYKSSVITNSEVPGNFLFSVMPNAVVNLFFGLLFLAIAIGLMMGKRWSRTLMVVFGLLFVLSNAGLLFLFSTLIFSYWQTSFAVIFSLVFWFLASFYLMSSRGSTEFFSEDKQR